MSDGKKLREPKLGPALNPMLAPSAVKTWNPWIEEHGPAAPAGVKKLKEPVLSGAIARSIPASKVKAWNPWPHAAEFGVRPPEGYSGAATAVPAVPAARTDAVSNEPKRIQFGTLPPLAKRMSRLGTESAFDVLARVRKLEAEGRKIVSFALGEPDFDTPLHVRESAKRALDAGQTHYGPSAGLPALRDAIARYISRSRRVDVKAEQVVVGPGAKPILFDTMMALLDEGDEVIYPNPGYPIYESLADWLGATCVPLPLLESKAFRFDIRDLAQRITPRTKLLVLNTPANPSGGVLTAEDLAGVAELAKKHNFWIIADEIYSEILYVSQYASILQQAGMAERTILIDGFSKTFAMTGWRLGYGVMPVELAAQIARIETNIDSCTCTFAQLAAIDALDGPWDDARRFRDAFQQRRDAIVDGLNSIKGIRCLRPDGAFYVFPNVTEACRNLGLKDSRAFQDKALLDAGVAVLARTCFGRKNEGEDQEYIRLSYATSMENIQEGIARLKKMCGAK